jgi:hypothetical protein
MFVAYVLVPASAASANTYAATNDFIRPKWLLANMTRLGVPESWITKLGLLKAAGAVGLLLGMVVPMVGTAAAVGLILFFVAPILARLRARDYSFGLAVGFLLLAVASLVLELHAREPGALALAARKETGHGSKRK